MASCCGDREQARGLRSPERGVGKCSALCSVWEAARCVQACEHYTSAEGVAELVKLKGGASEILKLETVVLQGLNFDLVVYEPYRCIDAMVQVRMRYPAAPSEA